MNELQKRLVKISGGVYRIAKSLNKDFLLLNSLNQVVKSSSSVGANYSEAQSAVSPKDFHNKIRIALKEMKETNYWLNYLIEVVPGNQEIHNLESESLELLKIVGTISKKTDPRIKPK